jgi:dihydrofolate reductase
MRKLIYAINTSLDGCVDHTKQIVSDEGPEYLEYFIQLMREADAQVFGRKTYELMVPYWPDAAKDPSQLSRGPRIWPGIYQHRQGRLFPDVEEC